MATILDNIQYLKGVGEKRALLFKKLGIDTVDALLRFYPRSYEDWSNITPIAQARGLADNVCIKASVITPVTEHRIRRNMILYKFKVRDASGVMQVTLFNSKFEAEKVHIGEDLLLYGKLSTETFQNEMSAPKLRPVDYQMLRPIYSATYGLTSAAIEKVVATALSSVVIKDTLPLDIIEKNKLCSAEYAIKNIHFPGSSEALAEAKRRLVFEELFMLQSSLLLIKNVNRGLTPCIMPQDHSAEFEGLLPFSLTSAQRRCIKEACADMAASRPMNRLIQGDVGSGKTAVAASCCYTAVKNGFQAAMMAPTEILAEQHFKTFEGFFKETGIRIALLTGSLSKKKKDEIKGALEQGKIDLIVGTHALLSDNVYFKSLGLVITDEQHRFGVEQRATLSEKGKSPHLLVMSATPIPRTLALIIHGDLDISIIDEYPKGRQTTKTYAVKSELHQRVYGYIKKFIDEGRQGYIVCPLVEEGEENTGLIPAEQYYEALSSGEFADYRLGLLHGKMKPRDKDAVMRAFAAGEIDLLIATTVIEVGVDVPNASIMVIENAERFGLSQLHQLRGRIGRGGYASDCILISDSASDNQRLKVMCQTVDGFEIADRDLALRGPGDFLGNRQHGLPELHIADLSADLAVLRSAGLQAKALLEADPLLKAENHAAFKAEIDRMIGRMKNN